MGQKLVFSWRSSTGAINIFFSPRSLHQQTALLFIMIFRECVLFLQVAYQIIYDVVLVIDFILRIQTTVRFLPHVFAKGRSVFENFFAEQALQPKKI